jgi:hypothetical protein
MNLIDKGGLSLKIGHKIFQKNIKGYRKDNTDPPGDLSQEFNNIQIFSHAIPLNFIMVFMGYEPGQARYE